MTRLKDNGTCKSYFLLENFKKEKFSNTVVLYDRNWSLIKTVKTDDIYRHYTLALWEETIDIK